MARKTRAQLEQAFKQYTAPDEDDYHNVIDSCLNRQDDGIDKKAGTPLILRPVDNEEHVLDLYSGDGLQSWRFSLKHPDTNKPGLNLATADGSSRIFIRRNDGSVGVGSVTPQARLHVAGDLALGSPPPVGTIPTVNGITNSIPWSTGARSANDLPTAHALKDYIDAMFTGTITAFAVNSAPSGWLECDGARVSRTTYARLFARVGTRFGAGNGSSTFQLPDLRGQFVRGYDSANGNRPVGSLEGDNIKDHTHNIARHRHSFSVDLGVESNSHDHDLTMPDGNGEGKAVWTIHNTDGIDCYDRHDTSVSGGAHTHTVPNISGSTDTKTNVTLGDNTGNTANETRPDNVALMYCIKT